MKTDFYKPCSICGKRRGHGVSHAACSPVLQKRQAETMAKPHINSRGKVTTLPDGHVVSEGEYQTAKHRRIAKGYAKPGNQAYWDRYE